MHKMGKAGMTALEAETAQTTMLDRTRDEVRVDAFY